MGKITIRPADLLADPDEICLYCGLTYALHINKRWRNHQIQFKALMARVERYENAIAIWGDGTDLEAIQEATGMDFGNLCWFAFSHRLPLPVVDDVIRENWGKVPWWKLSGMIMWKWRQTYIRGAKYLGLDPTAYTFEDLQADPGTKTKRKYKRKRTPLR